MKIGWRKIDFRRPIPGRGIRAPHLGGQSDSSDPLPDRLQGIHAPIPLRSAVRLSFQHELTRGHEIPRREIHHGGHVRRQFQIPDVFAARIPCFLCDGLRGGGQLLLAGAVPIEVTELHPDFAGSRSVPTLRRGMRGFQDPGSGFSP